MNAAHHSDSRVDALRARRWFWAMTMLAVPTMGALYQTPRSQPGLGSGILVLVSALALIATGVQAARIVTALAGPPRIPRPWEGATARPAKEK
ncbi:hypothetical protein [Streptomyces sp. 11x1]|uniref:hypothetical protein n=1 Tax=Streptomyces sp. 11x1 TaxID=3038642 RepID=UPI00293073FC|nr:hypothetical protein [Streptomyces sp. 11x1]WNZ07671.1 hypothetical protein P8T65_08825 [Streptomyces sp. 11x1]